MKFGRAAATIMTVPVGGIMFVEVAHSMMFAPVIAPVWRNGLSSGVV